MVITNPLFSPLELEDDAVSYQSDCQNRITIIGFLHCSRTLFSMTLSMSSPIGMVVSRRACPYHLYTLFGFAVMLLEVPIIRLFERAICDRHFRSVARSAIDEGACKIPEVQDLLAKVVGWKMSFDALPGMYFVEALPSPQMLVDDHLALRAFDGCVLRITRGQIWPTACFDALSAWTSHDAVRGCLYLSVF